MVHWSEYVQQKCSVCAKCSACLKWVRGPVQDCHVRCASRGGGGARAGATGDRAPGRGAAPPPARAFDSRSRFCVRACVVDPAPPGAGTRVCTCTVRVRAPGPSRAHGAGAWRARARVSGSIHAAAIRSPMLRKCARPTRDVYCMISRSTQLPHSLIESGLNFCELKCCELKRSAWF